ncbi:MAG: DNA recombination protein RmuC [Actinomycetales bacterium]
MELERTRGQVEAITRDRDRLQQEQADSRSLEDRLEPVRTALEGLKQESAKAATDRAAADAELREQIVGVRRNYATLEDATRKLVLAMTSGRSRGQWGEMQLEQLLEHSGLREGTHYRRQSTIAGDEGRARPDIIINLPGETHILVDAKFPFDAYWQAINLGDGPGAEDLMRKHAADVLARAKELAGKRYADTATSPDFVIMFLPLESLLQEALAVDGLLLEKTFQSNVILATPTSMLAMLRTIAFGYQRNALAQNAQRIQQLGADLYNRLLTLTEHVDRVRKGLEGAVKAYNDFVGSYDSRVLVSARQMRDLGASGGKTLEPPAEVVEALRQPRNAEPVALPGPPAQADPQVPSADGLAPVAGSEVVVDRIG